MSLFKTKEEKKIIAEMERQEHLDAFNEQINQLKAKQDEYAQKCAEAELNNDNSTLEQMESILFMLNERLSELNSAKANFDIITLTNSLNENLMGAYEALGRMSATGSTLNIRKIKKINNQIAKFMREQKISTAAANTALRQNNPATRTGLTPEQKQSIRPMIDAARAKMGSAALSASSAAPTTDIDDLMSQIEEEKNKII